MAICTKCGSELKPGAKFCMKCGNPVRITRNRYKDTFCLMDLQENSFFYLMN